MTISGNSWEQPGPQTATFTSTSSSVPIVYLGSWGSVHAGITWAAESSSNTRCLSWFTQETRSSKPLTRNRQRKGMSHSNECEHDWFYIETTFSRNRRYRLDRFSCTLCRREITGRRPMTPISRAFDGAIFYPVHMDFVEAKDDDL